MFLRMLEYKLIFLRKQSLKINRQVSQSEAYSKYKDIKIKLKLQKRNYECECYEIETDRDYNVALNIRKVEKIILEYKKIDQELPEELDKYIWLVIHRYFPRSSRF